MLHFPTAPWAGMAVPSAYVGAAALRAQPSSLAVERRSHLAYDTSYNNVLHRVAIVALHRNNLLLKKPHTLIKVNLIAAFLTLHSLLSRHDDLCLGNQTNSSTVFLVEQGFFIIRATRKFITIPMLLAPSGQTATHLMHDTHFFLSTFLILSRLIAPTGQPFEQIPQALHFLPAVG